MSVLLDNLLDKCIVNIKEEKFKSRVEKEIINPLINETCYRAKPYLFTLLYMYVIIVLLLIIIIAILLLKNNNTLKK
jgi:hypothetical protein